MYLRVEVTHLPSGKVWFSREYDFELVETLKKEILAADTSYEIQLKAGGIVLLKQDVLKDCAFQINTF